MEIPFDTASIFPESHLAMAFMFYDGALTLYKLADLGSFCQPAASFGVSLEKVPGPSKAETRTPFL